MMKDMIIRLDDLNEEFRNNIKECKLREVEQVKNLTAYLSEDGNCWTEEEFTKNLFSILEVILDINNSYYLNKKDLEKLSLCTLNYEVLFPYLEVMVGDRPVDPLNKIWDNLSAADKVLALKSFLMNKTTALEKVYTHLSSSGLLINKPRPTKTRYDNVLEELVSKRDIKVNRDILNFNLGSL